MSRPPNSLALSRVLGARDALDAQTRAYESVLKETFKPGMRVAWKHGDNWRHGVVRDVVGQRVRIEPETDSDCYWVSANRIIDAMYSAAHNRRDFG